MKIVPLFFMFFGVGLILVALQGARKGWLPIGPNGYKRGEGVRKDTQPLGFWFFFALYFAGGVWLILHSWRLFTGSATL